MSVCPVIVITHAAFDSRRREMLQRLTSQLRVEAPRVPFRIVSDEERKGSLWCWREAMRVGLNEKATHVVWLPDDALPCRDFGDILEACIRARPDDVFDCFSTYPGDLETLWYSTSDGYTGVGGVMPRELLLEHLAWRDAHPELEDYANDAGVNLWAIVTGRRIYKTAMSLVQHDATAPSLEGHDGQAVEREGLRPVDECRGGVTEDIKNFLGRTYAAPEEHLPGRATSSAHIGRTYDGNVWDVVRRLRPPWPLEAMYEAYAPAERTKVVIVVPVYRETEEVMRATMPSREATLDDLAAHGIEAEIWTPPGDSHVDRMRQRATHGALKMGATHVLWWDADISCDDPRAVRRFVTSGHDIVAGACPFKDESGKVVCNLREEDVDRIARGEPLTTLPGGYIEVMHGGSGFLMTSRKALLALMEAHPDRAHLSRSPGDFGEPLFAIWDGEVYGPEDVRGRMFLSEDYNLCRLWRELDGKVYVHAPSTFRHWGLFGYRADFANAFGLRAKG